MKYQETIEVGKLYRTREGKQVRIYAIDGELPCPIHGAIKRNNVWCCRIWTPMGLEYESNSASRNDIVGEWNEPEPPRYRPYHRLDTRKLIGEVVVDKEYEVMRLIGSIDDENNLVGLHGLNDCITFQQLLDHYTWVDGTPCGVLITTGSCVGAATGDGTEAMWGIPKAMAHAPPLGRKPKRDWTLDYYDPSNVDCVTRSFVKPNVP